MTLSKAIKRVPLIGTALVKMRRALSRATFNGSADYWEGRYLKGGNSGPGSYGRLAHFKADTINAIVQEFDVQSVIELGCGDGAQLELVEYPRYHGFDVSAAAVKLCEARFRDRPGFSFSLMDDLPTYRADLLLSLDVLYHLVEDAVFEGYLASLFNASDRLVLIYAADTDDVAFNTHHVKVRKFTDWVSQNRPDWRLTRHIPNKYPYRADCPDTSFADFYLYEKA